MHRVIFGDNQFFGINHMSEEKARSLGERFRTLDAVLSVLNEAQEAGVNALMLNSNHRAKSICDAIRADPDGLGRLHLYPSIPHPRKYAGLVAEKGLVGAAKEVMAGAGAHRGTVDLLLRGGASVVKKDLQEVMKILVDMEMAMFQDLRIEVVFLQNVVSDLLLTYDFGDIVRDYCTHIRREYGVPPGLITMNLPAMVDFLQRHEISDAVICTSINSAGYFMNPSVPAYEEVLTECGYRIVAMSVLASGAISPENAIEYVARLGGVDSVVFGASSKRHIQQTAQLIRTKIGSDNG